jgi:hypothetical protein
MSKPAAKSAETEGPTPEPPSAVRVADDGDAPLEAAEQAWLDGFKKRLDEMPPERVAAFERSAQRGDAAELLRRMLGVFPPEALERVSAERASRYGGDPERELAAIDAGEHPLQQSAA